MKKITLLLVALFVSWISYGQLPEFTLTVTPTFQTCLGNGSMSFEVSGTDPDASVDYAIYLLPDTVTPLVITTNPSVSGLQSGDYMVVATQSLNGESNTQQALVTISTEIDTLVYNLDEANVRCGNDGVITVNVIAGNPDTYEIMAGPVIVPPQASNVFENLPVGLYQIRVFDDCGEATVVSVQLVQLNTNIIWGGSTLAAGELPSCNTVIAQNAYTVPFGSYMFSPYSAVYTVYPPGGGAPVIVEHDPASYDDTNFYGEIPFYPGQAYSYDVVFTDVCGNEFEVLGNNVMANLTLKDFPILDSCTEGYFQLEPEYYVGPYTIDFIAAPPGFDPEAFNEDHPTFDIEVVQYGETGTYVPFGDYVAEITDACGRTAIAEFTLEAIEIPPTVTADTDLCSDEGSITIQIPGREIVVAVLTEAPDVYDEPLPQDVIGFVSNGELFMEDMPLGDYVFEITDDCGFTQDVNVSIVPPQGIEPDVDQHPGCLEGEGSVHIVNGAGQGIATAVITDAPAAFAETLPFDLAPYLDGGSIYMNSLPQGDYTFYLMDNCGTSVSYDVTVEGYEVAVNEMELIQHCGSFDVELHHTSNGNYIHSYWLQRYNDAEGVWEHPEDGTNYTEGTMPGSSNSIFLANNNTTINIESSGHLRILKVFYVFSNGSDQNFRCFEVIHEFDFAPGPVITDAYSFPCANGLTEVAVIAEGVPPLTYRITTKDGAPFVVENGESNLFTGLEAANYNFQVTDDCGNIRNIQFDIETLDPIEIVAEGFCEGEDSSLSVDEFSFLEYEWYEESAPGTILSTTGTLNFPAFNSATQAGTYILSITSGDGESCMDQVLEYVVEANALPNAGDDVAEIYCNIGETLNLSSFLSEPHDAGGIWQDTDATGALEGNMLDTEGLAPGTYAFTYIVTDACSLTDEAVLTFEVREVPDAPATETPDPVCEGEDVQLAAEDIPGAAYHWEGPGGFESSEQNPLLEDTTAAASGMYSVTITVNGCESEPANVEVVVDAAPRAGDDAEGVVCNDGVAIDLTDFLSGQFDNGGVWTDVDATGAVEGNMLNIGMLEEGTYEFTYNVTVACGLTDEATIILEMRDTPDAPDVDEVAPVCEGTDVQLTASDVADGVYLWTGPDGFESSEQNPLIAAAGVAAAGEYSVTVTVNGCTSQAAVVSVTVNVIPQFDIEGNTVLCEGQSSVLSVVPGNFPAGGVVYEWYYEGSVVEGETAGEIEISETGTYEVEVDNSGCITRNSIEVTANENPFTVELDTGCVNFDYIIAITNIDEIGDAVITWSGPEGFASSEAAIDITGFPTGEYSVVVTNAEGCTAEAAIPVENTSCSIPRGVSPNNDGLNDSFDLSNLDVREIKIFNRYGLKVYEAQNYIDEWHGQSDKGDLPTGTYYYVITLSAGKQVTGWVYLQLEI